MLPPRVSDPGTIAAFLGRLHTRRVVPVGPREYLAVECLLRSREDWPDADLCAALASVLSGSREEWAAVATEYHATFHPESVAAPLCEAEPRPGEPTPPQVRLQSIREPSRWERLLARLRSTLGRAWSIARNARRGWWVAGIALLIAALVAIAIGMLPSLKQRDTSSDGGSDPTAGTTDQSTGTVLRLLRPAATRSIAVPRSPSPSRSAPWPPSPSSDCSWADSASG